MLVLVHQTLLQDAVLAYSEPYPGRVLHLRVTHQSWALDCMVVYQRHLNWQHKQRVPPPLLATLVPRPRKLGIRSGTPSMAYCLSCRPDILYSCLVISTLHSPDTPRAGHQVARWNNRLPPDAARLTQIMDDHALTHLTSWSRRAGPTYICGPHRSVIDHVFTRAAQAVPIASWLAGIPSAWPHGAQLAIVRFVALNSPAVRVHTGMGSVCVAATV